MNIAPDTTIELILYLKNYESTHSWKLWNKAFTKAKALLDIEHILRI